MRARGCATFLWRLMVIFSFVVNLVLVLVLVGLGLFIFEIKNEVAQPLIGGLHSTAAGLDNATIDWTIPVRDELGIALNVPINADTITSEVTQISGQPVAPIAGETVVTLTRPVPLVINNAFIQSNDLTLRNAAVNITLPAGTQLPVALDLAVGLETEIPVELDVRAVIPISETQLHDPITTLGLLFEPLAIGLHNLPSDFSEAGEFAAQLVAGEPIDLLATDGSGFNAQAYQPWTGYSRTAGVDYTAYTEPFPPENRPIETGAIPPGGIPALDQLIRPWAYDEDGNFITSFAAQDASIPAYTYDGTIGQIIAEENDTIVVPLDAAPATDGSSATAENSADAQAVPNVGGSTGSSDAGNGGLGIIPTPGSP